MANYRQIHVSIWKDEWFLDLDAQEKLLFIYLFSNENTSLSGLYKLPMKVIAFETGLDRQYIIDTLSRFSNDDKIHYQDGVVWVVHMRRYHETKSEKVQKRIQDDIDLIPDCPLKIRYLYGMDTSPQLKEEEKENKKTPASANFSPDVTAECVFTNVTGMVVIPGKNRVEDLHTLRQLMALHGDGVVDYLSPFWNEWVSRKYNKANTAWLEWAVSGQIPSPKNAHREEVPSEVYG